MKVAVCISGQLRTGLRCLENQAHFLRGLDADFFLHTWSTNTNKRFPRDHEETPVPRQVIKDYVSALKPKRWTFEDQHLNFRGGKDIAPVALHYSWMKSVQLKQEHERHTGVSYDAVIKIRPDLLLRPERNPASSILEKVYGKRKLIIENIPEWWKVMDWHDDVMWFGDNETMNMATEYFQQTYVERTNAEAFGFFADKRGVDVDGTYEFSYAVYRKECEHFDPMTQYEECFECETHYTSTACTTLATPEESPDYYS